MATGTRALTETRYGAGDWIKHGALGGLVAGVVFAVFEMVVSAVQQGGAAFWMPLRMIGAMVLGQEAMEPGYSLAGAAVAGLVVHMVLSLAFGLVFGLAVAAVPALSRSAGVLVAAASLYGLLLWLVNFYLIASAAGWDWFPDKTDPLVQFVAHTFFFGTVLGLVLGRAVAPRRE